MDYRCWCGWFVQSMIPGISNLEPLESLAGGEVAEACDYLACLDDFCTPQGTEMQGLDLDEVVVGTCILLCNMKLLKRWILFSHRTVKCVVSISATA